jgi:hypothetical protein
VIRPDPIVSGSHAEDRHAKDPQNTSAQRDLTLRLDGFARETIDEEAARLGVPVEELVAFSVLYYLADVDSGRIARAIPTSLYPGIAR